MIRAEDLQEAIAECQGQRNPDARTCIKLAAYYTILDHISAREGGLVAASVDPMPPAGYSYSSGTEFSGVVREKNMDAVMPVIDDLMSALAVLHPKLYRATMQKLSDL